MSNGKRFFTLGKMAVVKNSNSVSPLVDEEEGPETPKKNKGGRNSKRICVLFRITNGLQLPHFAVILTNLVLSVPVLLLVFAYFARAIMEDLEVRPEPVRKAGTNNETYGSDVMTWGPDYGFPSKLYCESYLTWSLFIEFASQFLYTGGSLLLLIGALKRNKRFCYCFVVSGIVAFFLAAMIRSGQFVLCDKNQVTKAKGRVHPYLPPLYKLTFIWLVCQLFWYWLVLSLVVALLNWMHEQEGDESGRETPTASTSSSSTSPPSPTPEEEQEGKKDGKGEEEKAKKV